VLLVDDAPSHPRESVLTSDDSLTIVKLSSLSVTAIMQPMDKGMIASMKGHYWADLLELLPIKMTA
jgi:hypothetical protein